jgi:hypothetical protein
MDEYRKYRNIVKNIHVPEELKRDLLLQAENRKKKEASDRIKEFQVGRKAADETEKQLTGKKGQDRGKRIKFAGSRRKIQRVTKGVAAAACVCALLTGVLAYQNLLPGTAASMTGNAGADQQAGAAEVPDGSSNGEVSGKVDNRNRFYLAGPEEEAGDVTASSMQEENGTVMDPSEESMTEENADGESGTSEGKNVEDYQDSFAQTGQAGSDVVKRIALTPVDTYAGTQYFPGCEFLVGGDNIRSVSLQIDRGGLYTVAAETMTDIEAREKRKELEQNADYIAENYKITDYEIDETNASQNDSIVTFYTKTYVGQTLTLEGGEEMQERIGFYLPDEAFSDADEAADLRQSAHQSLDYLNGAVLSLEVTFSDGAEGNYSYRLNTGKIKYSYEGGEGHTLPEFLSDEETQDQPYVYGILLTDVTVQQ